MKKMKSIYTNIPGQFAQGLLILLISLCFVYARAQSADDRPAAISTPSGVFVYLGRNIPKQNYYEVEIKGDRGNYTKLSSVKAPQNQKEMDVAITEYRSYFEMLSPLTLSERERMWRYLEVNTTMDSLYVPNLPLLHLAAGTAYLDKKVEAGSDFQYRVSLYRPDGSLISRKESNKVGFPASPDLLRPLFRQVRTSGRQIMLEWYVTEQRQLSAYQVFRRVFGRGEYQEAPVIKGFNAHADSVFLVVTDTAARSPAYYEYYVVPLDAYGNAGPASEAVGAGTLGRYVPLVERFRALSMDKDHEISLSWKFDPGKYLRSIEIYRSLHYDSAFVKIAELPSTDSTYTDLVPQGSENHYYYVVLNGPSGKSHPSAVISVLYQDTNVPASPVEIATETVDNGVRVHWTYQEPFVKGFFVYRSESPDGDFHVISPFIPYETELLSYTDTSGALLGSQAYYYAIEAVSDSDISSKLSVAINGTPGVKSQVSPPQDPEVQWADNGVLISWDDLSETEPDLLGYVVFRRVEGSDFERIYESLDGHTKNYFQDMKIEPGKTYEYAIQSHDLTGQTSALSNVVKFVVPVIKPLPPSQINLSATTGGIHIAWGQLSLTDLSGFRLYRQVAGQNPEFVTALDKDQLDYLDKAVEKGNLYSYFLTSVNNSNVEGDPGDLATIRY